MGALLGRVLQEEGIDFKLSVRSARGGAPRMLEEFKTSQTIVRKKYTRVSVPDLLVLARDANCNSWKEVHKQQRK